MGFHSKVTPFRYATRCLQPCFRCLGIIVSVVHSVRVIGWSVAYVRELPGDTCIPPTGMGGRAGWVADAGRELTVMSVTAVTERTVERKVLVRMMVSLIAVYGVPLFGREVALLYG